MSEHTVEEVDADIRVDRWFKRRFPQFTHGLLEKSLRKGDIRVNGKKVKASDRTVAGQVIEIRCPIPEAMKREPRLQAKPLTPENIQMMQQAVLFKNDDVIVINKPPGLAVQGGTGIHQSVDGMLDALRFERNDRPKLVHRLDRDTSGVLVLARHTRAATQLMPFFAAKKAEKTYWALVKGVPEVLQGKIDLPLAKQDEGDIEKVAIAETDGKRAVTLYTVVEALSRTLAWVELMPVTGRMHQLRVHMAAIGHPILGDGKYGGRDAFITGMELSQKLHLHARRIKIPGVLDVTAPLPKHMLNSWNTLGLEA